SWLGCAEAVLTNSAHKPLSVHEILAAITQSELLLKDTAAYTHLAAALFSEIQRPNSRFARNGNKFTLRHNSNHPPSDPLSDRTLCSRRRRTAPQPNNLVKLSTATNPTGRARSSLTPPAPDYLTLTSTKRHTRPTNLSAPPKPSNPKRVQFALDRNETFYFTPEAQSFDLNPTP
ncbi:hypothetical protein L0F63_007182, partial [Massospora cicadina]